MPYQISRHGCAVLDEWMMAHVYAQDKVCISAHGQKCCCSNEVWGFLQKRDLILSRTKKAVKIAAQSRSTYSIDCIDFLLRIWVIGVKILDLSIWPDARLAL